jgi:hypothetical protein
VLQISVFDRNFACSRGLGSEVGSMTIRDSRSTSYELTPEQARNARRQLALMDMGLRPPPIESRPDVGPLTPTIDQLGEAYHDGGIDGFRKALKALSIDQPALATLYETICKARRYRPVNIPQLLDMPEQEWLLTNFIYEDAISVLYGEPGCGKSFIALDWACHWALGIPWLGRSTKRCRVIYVATEGVRGYRRRIRAWCHSHRHSPEDLLDAIAFVPCAIPLGQEAEIDAFIEMQAISLENYRDGLPVILILDTIFQCAAGMNINQTDVATLLISSVQRIKEELHATHVLLVHHSGKDKERGMSGNMALKASTDLTYRVEKDRDGEITVFADKVKDDESTVTYLKLERVFYGDGDRDHSCVVVAGEKTAKPTQLPLIEKRMLEALPGESDGQGLTFTEWFKAVEINRSTFNRHKDMLLSKGLIRNIGTETKPVYIRVSQELEETDDLE